MYRLGFDDINQPSSDFNEELKKYGTFHYYHPIGMNPYDYRFREDWNCFTINEHGRDIIKAIDRERNVFWGLKKLFRFLRSAFWSLFVSALGLAFFVLLHTTLQVLIIQKNTLGLWGFGM